MVMVVIEEGAMIVIEVIRKFQLNGDNTARYPVDKDTVLSIQPNGEIQTRPKGTAGPYEVYEMSDKGLVYSPLGQNGSSYLIPYVD